MTPEIAYPVAYSEARQAIIRIGEAPREQGQAYSCVHCRQRMSAVVQVTKKTPHFRHTRPEERCDPADALHTYTIMMIQQAHSNAVTRDGTYMLMRPCERCTNAATSINLARGWQCEDEKSIVAHTRSDLAFTHEEGSQFAIEVVVSHAVEPEAQAAYAQARVPVAIIRPTWETIVGF